MSETTATVEKGAEREGTATPPSNETMEKQVSEFRTTDEESGNKHQPHLHAKTYLAVLAVCVIYFAQIYNLVGAGAQTNAIALTFTGSTSSSSNSVWLSASIAIATAVLSPIVSQAADYWGRRWFLVILTLMGAVGSIVIARATSMSMAIAGTTITGLSYGAQPLLHAVSSEVLPRRYRSWGQAADLVANAFGGITALCVAGAFNRTANAPSEGFRNFWYLGFALFFVSAVLCAVLYHPPATEKQNLSMSEKLAKLDWVGYFLLSAGIVLFSAGLAWSENPYPWTDPHTSATFAVGLFLIVVLTGYETFVKKDGMFHHGLFQNRNFPLAIFCIFCEGLAFFGANQYFAFQVGVLYETDALIVDVRFAIAMIVSIFSAAGAGVYCAVTKKTRWILVLSFVFFVVFFACMAKSSPSTSQQVWGYPVFLGMGLGMSLVTLVTAAQLSTPPELIAITSGLVIGLRSLGGSVGLAIYNALFTDAMGHLGDNIAEAVIPLGLPVNETGAFIGLLAAQDTASLFQLPGVTPQIVGAGAEALLETYMTGFQHVWIAAACFVAVAAIAAAFMKDPTKEFNMHIDAPVEREESLYSQ